MTQIVKPFPLLVKVALLKRGMSVTSLARAVKRNRCVVSTAIHSDRYPRTRDAVARHLKLEISA